MHNPPAPIRLATGGAVGLMFFAAEQQARQQDGRDKGPLPRPLPSVHPALLSWRSPPVSACSIESAKAMGPPVGPCNLYSTRNDRFPLVMGRSIYRNL